MKLEDLVIEKRISGQQKHMQFLKADELAGLVYPADIQVEIIGPRGVLVASKSIGQTVLTMQG